MITALVLVGALGFIGWIVAAGYFLDWRAAARNADYWRQRCEGRVERRDEEVRLLSDAESVPVEGCEERAG